MGGVFIYYVGYIFVVVGFYIYGIFDGYVWLVVVGGVVCNLVGNGCVLVIWVVLFEVY